MLKALRSIILVGLILSAWSQFSHAQQIVDISPNILDRIKLNQEFFTQVRDSFVVYDSAQLDSLIEANMAGYHLPGVAICVVKDSNIVYTRNFGWANIERGIPVADTTVFLTGSISKTFVANAAMQMWENGYLDLDADINGYIPFSVVNPFYPDSIITMRTILSHTSSIDRRDETWLPDLVLDQDNPVPLGEYLEDYLDPDGTNYSVYNYLMSPPGHEFEYSNYAVALAGYIIEQIAVNNGIADTFEQYCRDSLWEPLVMNETSWFLGNLDTNNIAVQYEYAGGYVRYGFSGFPIYPAGQLRTSSIQLARHLMAFMLHGELNGQRILESATVDTMMSIQYPGTPSDTPYEMWGLGWYKLYDDSWPYLYWGHTGGTTGCRAWMMFDPVESCGFIVLTNGSSDNGASAIAIAVAGFASDYDLDGIVTGFDNCPLTANPYQEDTDEDGLGDSCDNCIEVVNADQDNPDDDNFGTACDNCPDITNNDQNNSDNDSHGDACDNCPDVDNEDQADSDEDGIGDACEYVCGDVNGTQTVNILDITYLIAYLYKEGPPPVPMEAADVNGTGTVNILDITYLISFLYKEGPEPNCLH